MSSRMDAVEPTLLPYLDSRSPGIAIRFGGKGQTAETRSRPADGSGPYTTLRWGGVVVDGAGTIAELIIVFQADQYVDGDSGWTPVTNTDMERHWQDTLGRCANAAADPARGFPFLRTDTPGVFRPWRPLFHCSHVDAFCHPLCPYCGHELTLCRDDGLLQKAGLPAFSDSLQRFLHCPPCLATEDAPIFYTRSTMAHPPANVRDGHFLVENFSRLLAKTTLAEALPCIECRHAADCYGPDAMALKRMRPFQFYPFHMLVQPAPDINAVDFIGLLSGADPDALSSQIGRQPDRERWARFSALRPKLHGTNGLLFPPDPINFAEILYLKLSFLQELYALWTSDRHMPAGGMSMENVWVKLGGQGVGIPWLWNFTLQSVDPFGRPALQVSGSDDPRGDLHMRLGQAWFYVLLVNPRQSMSAVKAAARQMVSAVERDGCLDLRTADGVFSAGNIGWPDRPPDMTPELDALWHAAVRLGLGLMRPQRARIQGVDDVFASALSDLKSQVRNALFRQDPALPQPGPEADHHVNDQRIGDIVAAIARQWDAAGDPRRTDKPAADPVEKASIPPAGRPNEDGDYEETVILAPDERPVSSPVPGQTAESPEPALDKTLVPSPAMTSREFENLNETVVIRRPPKQVQASPDPEATMVPASGEDTTRHLAMGKAIGIRSTMGARSDDDLEKTPVVSRPGASRGPSEPPRRTDPGPPPPATPDDDLEQTLEIAPGKGPGADAPIVADQDPEASIDEDLPETLILQPRKNKNGKP